MQHCPLELFLSTLSNQQTPGIRTLMRFTASFAIFNDRVFLQKT
jgi:hypothetical protein